MRRHVTPEVFNHEEHIDVLVTLGKGGAVHSVFAKVLAQHGLDRKVKAAVPSFAAAAHLASQTDLIACLPTRASQMLASRLPLRLLPLPVKLPPFPLALHWHERTQHDPASRYFRSLVIETLRANDPA